MASTGMQRFSPKILLGLSFSSLVLLYSVMLIGVYISSSNQGLSCPDWPLCPNGFGFPEPRHFYEHMHRLIVVITAAVMVATALYAVRNLKSGGAVKAALIMTGLMGLQITIGFFVVYTRLTPIIVAIHLSTGIALFAMTLMTFLSSYRLMKKGS